jgi:hypothetical protein
MLSQNRHFKGRHRLIASKRIETAKNRCLYTTVVSPDMPQLLIWSHLSLSSKMSAHFRYTPGALHWSVGFGAWCKRCLFPGTLIALKVIDYLVSLVPYHRFFPCSDLPPCASPSHLACANWWRQRHWRSTSIYTTITCLLIHFYQLPCNARTWLHDLNLTQDTPTKTDQTILINWVLYSKQTYHRGWMPFSLFLVFGSWNPLQE